MIKTLSTLYKRHRNLVLKKKAHLLHQFEETNFHVPVPQLHASTDAIERSMWMQRLQCHVVQTRKSLLRNERKEALRTTVNDLSDELCAVNTELMTLRKQVVASQTSAHNAKRREKRKVKRLNRKEGIIRQLTKDNKNLMESLKKMEENLELVKQKSQTKLYNCRKQYQKKKARYKSRCRRLNKGKQHIFVGGTSESTECEESKEERERTIETYSKGQYNSKVRECCMDLLSHNVGIHNVENCIKAVCELVGCEPDWLPSKSTLANMMIEAQAISHVQIAECVPNFETNMLHSDGTTKFGEKYGGVQISTPDSCYTLCLTTMKAGGAQNFMELLTNALSDVSRAYQASGNDNDVSKRILVSIKNTMSDRHIVEKKFNELLESYRAEVLPQMIQGWSTLTTDQQLSLAQINNFFCGLHFLVGLADAAAETLKNWEAVVLEDDELMNGSEAGTIHLIQTVCKAIQKQCSQQAGCHLMFKAYLQSQGVGIFPISKFQGNRFNVVFHNAAGVFYVRNHLSQYLLEIHPNLNRLLQAVLRDLKIDHFLVGCRALGLIDKCITGPLWRLLESTQSMSALGKLYQKLHHHFLKWSEDASELLSGNGLNDVINEKDLVFVELLSSSESDQQTCELLEMLCKSFWLVSDRLLGDHLEDGTYSEMDTATLDKETVDLPVTNVCSERDFALLDRLLREKPNCSAVALESMIMFKRNKTAQWLKTKNPAEKERLFKSCIRIGREQHHIDRLRQESILAYRQQAINDREASLINKRAKEQVRKEKLCHEISIQGFWNSKTKVDAGIESKSEAIRKKCLEVQLRFRQHVLRQPTADKSLYCLSKGGKKLPSAKLAVNLLQLISEHRQPSLKEIIDSPHFLVGLEVTHRFEDDEGNLTWYNGVVISLNGKEHEIIYMGEEEIHQFDLMQDIFNNDVGNRTNSFY